MQKISEGDFTHRLEFDPAIDDENDASLARSFNLMVESLAKRRDRLVELDTLKTDFVSSVSHELRTPLTTIKALTRLLMRKDLVEAKRQEYLATISLECDREIDLSTLR